MNTVISEVKIQFKETTTTITDSDEIFVGSGLIYCSDFKMWLDDEEVQDSNFFQSYRTSNSNKKCLQVKYYLSELATPRYQYCIYCTSDYTGAPYDKTATYLD